jgi:mycothiol synthase
MTDSPELNDLISRATAADGSPPFSDGALVQLAHGARELVWEFDAEGHRVGAALDSRAGAEFVVDPQFRRQGHGARMLDMLTHPSRGGAGTAKLFWAHGDHPAARALAAHHRLESIRTLEHLRLEPIPAGSRGDTVAFTPADADAWVALNALVFAAHPEQGAITRADLDTTMTEIWFDPEDFLLLTQSGELIGYAWLKIVDGEGEFYAVGVAPDRQGTGIGRALMAAGFARLAERGIHSAHLYVEGDNEAALGLYRSIGFVEASVDRQYHYVR